MLLWPTLPPRNPATDKNPDQRLLSPGGGGSNFLFCNSLLLRRNDKLRELSRFAQQRREKRRDHAIFVGFARFGEFGVEPGIPLPDSTGLHLGLGKSDDKRAHRRLRTTHVDGQIVIL